MQRLLTGFLVLTTTLSTGCNSSSSDSPENGDAAPFGLEEREEVSGLTFPSGPAEPTEYERIEAFPSLVFSSPIFLTSPNDGTDRICVVERGGRILIFPNSPEATTSSVFLDIRDRVKSGGEEGLLGLAFDPRYAENGFLYVHYSAASPRRSVIARFEVSDGDADFADPASEAILLEVAQPYTNHNGGMVAFGPDGLLYLSLGDGGSGGDPHRNGQDRTTLLGTVLRIEPLADGTYDVPADNPFAGEGGGVRGEIWAYGLRHPWRFSFDRQEGTLWLGDVGQGDREEIDVVERGDNLGWRYYEGDRNYINPNGHPRSDFVSPILDYGRGQGNCIIGGYVYRGTALPSLRGAYVYGDNGTGRVWSLRHENFASVETTRIGTVSGLASFGEDENGEIYAISVGGRIYRFVEDGGVDTGAFPTTLSATGLFTDTIALAPAPGVIEYDVNAPLWSDEARKRRWIALPGDETIRFDATGAWEFPPGTVLVKHFEIDLVVGDPESSRRLETRVLILDDQGWAGYTYRWNQAQTDADLLADSATDVIAIEDPATPDAELEFTWTYPGRADCMRCHTAAAGFVLGVRTRQLNRDFEYGSIVDNQLRSWNHIGLFSRNVGKPTRFERLAEIDEEAASIHDRARAYLAVNCAMCHRPDGPTPTALDLRFGVEITEMGILGVPPASGDLGIQDAAIVTPGVKETSVLLQRIRRTDELRMPPLGSVRVDGWAEDFIGEWIDDM